MKLKAKFLQQGGTAPAEQPQGQGPEEQIMAIAQQLVQQLGPEAAALLAQAIIQMLQGSQGGGEQPASTPAPTYAKKGGRLVKVTKQ